MSAVEFISMWTTPPDTHRLWARSEISGEALGSAKNLSSSIDPSLARLFTSCKPCVHYASARRIGSREATLRLNLRPGTPVGQTLPHKAIIVPNVTVNDVELRLAAAQPFRVMRLTRLARRCDHRASPSRTQRTVVWLRGGHCLPGEHVGLRIDSAFSTQSTAYMIQHRGHGEFRTVALYATVAVFTVAWMLFDSWPSPPRSPAEWLVLILLVFPVVQIGELIGGGILRNALTALTSKDDERFPSRRWRVFYYCVMCMLFAVTTVSVFEWLREISARDS